MRHNVNSDCYFFARYHEFKIKLPEGARVQTRLEVGGKDKEAILCVVPDDLEESILSTTMTSKSSKKSYQVRDVVGKTVGRVQYFLSGTFRQLLLENKVEEITG